MPRVAQSGRIMPRYIGGSTAFNGTNSTIPTTLTSNDVFKTGNGFTMWRWIYARSMGEGSSGYIYDKSSDVNATGGLKFQLFNSALLTRINAGTSRASATNSILLNQWTLALVTVAADATVTHYINSAASGTSAATGALAGITTANPLTIGNRSTATDRTFDGLMGEGGICPRVITQAEITNLYQHGILPAGTAHHWKLDDLPSTYLDTIGGATGTGTNTTWSPSVPVQLRTAIDWEARSSLSFDGVDDYVTITHDASQLFTTEFSIALSVKVDTNVAPNGYYGLIEKELYQQTGWFFHLVNNNSGSMKPLLRLGYSGVVKSYSVSASNAIDFTKYRSLGFSYNTDTVSFYIDGKLIEKVTIDGVTGIVENTDNITVGKESTRILDGNISRMVMSNRAWSTTEFANLHFNNIVPQEGLVLDLPMNEGAGTIAYDKSGNGNNGTITGATWSAELPPPGPRVASSGRVQIT